MTPRTLCKRLKTRGAHKSTRNTRRRTSPCPSSRRYVQLDTTLLPRSAIRGPARMYLDARVRARARTHFSRVRNACGQSCSVPRPRWFVCVWTCVCACVCVRVKVGVLGGCGGARRRGPLADTFCVYTRARRNRDHASCIGATEWWWIACHGRWTWVMSRTCAHSLASWKSFSFTGGTRQDDGSS